MTDRYSYEKLFLICLRHLRYIKREPRTYEASFDSTLFKGRHTDQTIGKSILEIQGNNRLVLQIAEHKHMKVPKL